MTIIISACLQAVINMCSKWDKPFMKRRGFAATEQQGTNCTWSELSCWSGEARFLRRVELVHDYCWKAMIILLESKTSSLSWFAWKRWPHTDGKWSCMRWHICLFHHLFLTLQIIRYVDHQKQWSSCACYCHLGDNIQAKYRGFKVGWGRKICCSLYKWPLMNRIVVIQQ